MALPASLSVLLSTPRRRRVLVALAAGHILTQMSSLPVALSVATLADHFEVGIDEAAWIVIVYLLALGSGALLGARLGDRYGHSRVYVLGVMASTLGAGLDSGGAVVMGGDGVQGAIGSGGGVDDRECECDPGIHVPGERAGSGVCGADHGVEAGDAVRAGQLRAVAGVCDLADSVRHFPADRDPGRSVVLRVDQGASAGVGTRGEAGLGAD